MKRRADANQRKHARTATQGERDLARLALAQMECEQLCVSLAPAPEPKHNGHQIRVVDQRNPEWYQALAAARPRSASIRASVFRALERIADGWVDPSPWSMAEEVLEVLGDQADEWFGPEVA